MTADPRAPHLGVELQQWQWPAGEMIDERFMQAAAAELYGAGFVLEPDVDVRILSQIAMRAAELKRAEMENKK